MNIIVCIKRTPDTETRIRIAEGDAEIDPAGVKFIVSPYDEFAVENALRAKEAAGEGTVRVLTLGDASSKETLRAALAMGADAGTLLEGRVSQDGLATAKALAAEVEGDDAELVLLGVKAADDDQQQVGPMLATLLGRPCVTAVSSFTVENGVAVCQREVEGGTEVVEVPLPAVLTITKGPFDPRYASLKGIMAAKKKPIEEKPAVDLEHRLEVVRLSPPPERPEGRIVGEGADAAPELARLLREEARVL
ncbi:MAG: electron transfer flavoprotein subunit beta/FixA family protein [Longimicrobiales bacterium]|nr:electron transfer flavoprotein subunit beta/FixA family protein [Longimicrobiales bacterium]